MPAINNLEWLNKNSHRAYPIKEGSLQQDHSGTYTLTPSFIVDLLWAVDVHKDRTFYLKYLSVLPDVITGQIYDNIDQPAATFTVDISLHSTYQAYELSGVKDYTNCVGKIIIGEVDPILAEPLGLFTFDVGATEFEATTVVPHIRGVTGISKLPQGDTTFPILQGNVRVKNGINTRPVINIASNSFRIDALDGVGLGPICDCPDEGPPPPCIAFINGIPPDNFFNFNVRGIGCIEVVGIENGIEIRNTCVTNCCECDDLEALEARIAAAELALGI